MMYDVNNCKFHAPCGVCTYHEKLCSEACAKELSEDKKAPMCRWEGRWDSPTDKYIATKDAPRSEAINEVCSYYDTETGARCLGQKGAPETECKGNLINCEL